MALSTYSDLLSAVGDWLDRSDLEARIPDFIRLAESRLNRLLDDPEMEIATTLTANDEATPLPADFGEMVSISTGNGALQAMGPVEFAAVDPSITGTPRYYSIVDQEIRFAPANSTASISLVYRRSIPSLTADNPTNWLMTRAPDVYLYGALLHAEAYDPNDERVPLWKAAFDEAIGELRTDGARRKWGPSMAPRIRRT